MSVHPISASALLPVIKDYKMLTNPSKWVVWYSGINAQLPIALLEGGGINPGQYTKDNAQGMINAEVLLSVTPPPQMPAF
jgi:nitrate/nitrite transport system substrate-binding protein